MDGDFWDFPDVLRSWDWTCPRGVVQRSTLVRRSGRGRTVITKSEYQKDINKRNYADNSMRRGSNRNTVGFGENWVRGTRHIFGTWSFIFWSQNVKKILTSHGNWQIKYLLKMQHAYHLATGEAQTATCLLNCNMLTTQPTGEAQTATCLPKRYLGKRVAVWASPFGKLQHAYHSAKWRVSNRNMLTQKVFR